MDKMNTAVKAKGNTLTLKKLMKYRRKAIWFDRIDRIQTAWGVLTGKMRIFSLPNERTESKYEDLFFYEEKKK